MKKIILKRKKLYLGIIILLTSAGTVFFFPLNIGGHYTCFYHRLFDHDCPVAGADQAGQQPEDPNHSSTCERDGMAGSKNEGEEHRHGSVLLDNYLNQYAFPWWVSTGLLAVCIYTLIKRKGRLPENNANFKIK